MYGMNRTFHIISGHLLTLQHSIHLIGWRNLSLGIVFVRLERSGVSKPAARSELSLKLSGCMFEGCQRSRSSLRCHSTACILCWTTAYGSMASNHTAQVSVITLTVPGLKFLLAPDLSFLSDNVGIRALGSHKASNRSSMPRLKG